MDRLLSEPLPTEWAGPTRPIYCMTKPTYEQFCLATLSPDMVRVVQNEILTRGVSAYTSAVTATAPYGFESSDYSFIPESATDETKIALLAAKRGMVMAAIARDFTRDDFAALLTNSYGVPGHTAQGLIERHMSFEDYDASNILRSMTSALPSATGGTVQELASSALNLFDSIVADKWQQKHEFTLRRWRDFGRLLMSLPDDALLTTVVLTPKSGGMSDEGRDTSSSMAQALMMFALGMMPTAMGRGWSAFKKFRMGRAAASAASKTTGGGAVVVPRLPTLPQLPGGNVPQLPSRVEADDLREFGDYGDEEGDYAYDIEDEDNLIVLPEAGDLMVHPHLAVQDDVLPPHLRSQAADLLRELIEGWESVERGQLEEGGFFGNLFKKITPFISEAVTAVGGAVGSMGGPLGTMAGSALGKLAGDALEGAASSGGKKKRRNTAVDPIRAGGSRQAERKLVKTFGQRTANLVDAARAPALVHGRAPLNQNLIKLFAQKGNRATLGDIEAAARGR